MDKLETLIREIAGDGVAMEDIASKFNKVMNSIEKEQEEEERKRKQEETEKSAVVSEIRNAEARFNAKYNEVKVSEKNFDINDVMDLAIWALADKNWKVRQLDCFTENLRENIKTIIDLCSDTSGKALSNLLDDISKKIDDSGLWDKQIMRNWLNKMSW